MRPHRILVIAEGQLGDLLLLTPALRNLKDSFPRASLALLLVQRRSYASDPRPPPLIRQDPAEGTSETVAPLVDEVIEISRPVLKQTRGLGRLRAEWTLLRRLRMGNFDTVLSCFPEDRFALWSVLSGARRRIGQHDQPFAWLYTVRPVIRKEEGGVLRYYNELVSAAGASARTEATEFAVTDHAREIAGELLGSKGIASGERFAVIHPGASGPFRVWPPERFARVAEVLQSEEGIRSVLCGTAYDVHILKAVRSHLTIDVPEILLGGSVGQLAGILSRAAICISNDSGPRHLAIAVGTPSVAILPKHNDRAWGVYDIGPKASICMATETCPLCPPDRCLDRHPEGEEFGSACIRLVSLDDVLHRVRRTLHSS